MYQKIDNEKETEFAERFCRDSYQNCLLDSF